MTITARFSSVCPNCHNQINAGERVEWSRGNAARHLSCQAAPVAQLSEEDPEFGREDPRSPHYRSSCRQPETCPLHSYNGRHPTGRALNADCEHPQFHRSDCVCAKSFPIGTDADDRSYDAWTAHLASRPSRVAIEDSGVYVLSDGAIVKVQANREKTRTYAKRWTVIGGTRLTEADTREHGEYVYEGGLVQQVAAEGRKMSLEEAKAFILRYGVCARCGRGLKDATSVERGIGPVCIRYFSAGTTGADLIAAPATRRSRAALPAIVDPSTLEDDRQARVAEWLRQKGFAS